MHIRYVILCLAALLACAMEATPVTPIWISPKSIDDARLLNENYDAERGFWTTIEVGAGSRYGSIALMDSKGILWIMFGTQRDPFHESLLFTVWNYNPETDQYRYVWGGEDTAVGMNPRNPGDLRVPNITNHPGGVVWASGTIDNNDNIWFHVVAQPVSPELWMFNTTSMVFTRMFGVPLTQVNPSVGAVPGQPGEDVWPGMVQEQCVVADSLNNIWMLSGLSTVNNPRGTGIVNAVWHFNTTSYLWTFVGGDLTADPSNATYYGGATRAGCFIDDNDRVWLFGGAGGSGFYSSIWTFDTRKKREYELEYGDNTVSQKPQVASDDFHPDNHPGGSFGPLLADRKDGTLIVVTGQQPNSQNGRTNQIWLYNKGLKQWKLASGEISGENPGAFTNYRQPGSVFPATSGFSRSDGKNMNGDVYIVGGVRGRGMAVNDIWMISKEQQNQPGSVPSPKGPDQHSNANMITGSVVLMLTCFYLL